jgi:hypothetical protein
MTRTSKCNGAPGTGVHGVGSQTSFPATNGTTTVAAPAFNALSVAVNVAPTEWLETSETTFVSEIWGGPGHVPPYAALPPRNTTSEPTATQTGVSGPGVAVTVTVPLPQPGRATPELPVPGGRRVVCVTAVAGARVVGAPDGCDDGDAQPATNTANPANPASGARRRMVITQL